MQLRKTSHHSSKILVVKFSIPHLQLSRHSQRCPGTWRTHVCMHTCTPYTCRKPHPFASVRGHETFEFLRDSLVPVWNEVGELTSHPTLCINDRQYMYSLPVVFGTDYKFGMHILQVSFSNPLVTVPADDGTEQCHFHLLLYLVHCKQGGKVYVHIYICMYIYTQLCRWDMTVPEAVYNSPSLGKGRTLDAMTRNSSYSQPKKHLGSNNIADRVVKPGY